MRGSVESLYEELENVPEDWSIRLRLIENAIETGDREEAKRLVRNSPGNDALPEELRSRVYELMTRHWTPELP